MALRFSSTQAVSRAAAPARRSVVVRASAEPANRRQILGLSAAFALSAVLTAAPAKADLTADLLARSEANKELNNKKRLATSSANLARTRTVTDGTCGFPTNFFGCDETSSKFNGGIKFIQDDVDLECAGAEKGRCASRPNMNFGSKGF
ncbi:photosystem I reaction center subunit N [Raphidocelis subcapitata]|uniref:Photosystem I reaction center subunit N n=1 Tax=Raphidocelis subcapitata TaxID=307507 RepID=A0A2V0PLV8_9CHLO|nr:photosystem I reaction center subunit N [Raphidocelis subcapitata]|eukprot:GBF99053.1 photosystem I reaction center subunit N [Raphidocelis subcapitata]